MLPAFEHDTNGSPGQGRTGQVIGELPVLVDYSPRGGPNQQIAICRHAYSLDGLAANLGIHLNKTHAIETSQSGSGPDPQVPVFGLKDLVNGLARQSALRGPTVVAILADLLSRIEPPHPSG